MKRSRIDYGKIAPNAIKAMLATNAYLDDAALPQGLRRLVELRVSQINGCRYCIWLHAKQAREAGESEERIAAVVDWQNSECFDASEVAAFEWSDAVTLITEGTPPDAAYKELLNHFDDIQVVELTAAIANMNAMNRMGISFCDEPPGV